MPTKKATERATKLKPTKTKKPAKANISKKRTPATNKTTVPKSSR